MLEKCLDVRDGKRGPRLTFVGLVFVLFVFGVGAPTLAQVLELFPLRRCPPSRCVQQKTRFHFPRLF